MIMSGLKRFLLLVGMSTHTDNQDMKASVNSDITIAIVRNGNSWTCSSAIITSEIFMYLF